MADTVLWCTTHEVPHPPDGWHENCAPSADHLVGALADVISQAHEAGIRYGPWSMARFILERWPVCAERATVPEAIRQGTPTSRKVVAEIMALVDGLHPPAAVRDDIERRVLFTYAAGLVGGRAGRQPEVEALQAALVRRRPQ